MFGISMQHLYKKAPVDQETLFRCERSREQLLFFFSQIVSFAAIICDANDTKPIVIVLRGSKVRVNRDSVSFYYFTEFGAAFFRGRGIIYQHETSAGDLR